MWQPIDADRGDSTVAVRRQSLQRLFDSTLTM
jgi:hypothetical protein